MTEICKICGEEVLTDKHYYNSHKIKVAQYFTEYEPRHDLLTGEPIPFKNKEQYLSSQFLNKNNLKKYLKSLSLSDARAFCADFLKQRKEVKNLVYTPSQVELRSIASPSIVFLNEVFEGKYNQFCESIGLKKRFNILEDRLDDPAKTEVASKTIFVDTREQKHLNLNCQIELKKLDYGDYYFDNSFNIYVERKSLSDFVGSFGKGYERFCREIDRAQKDGAFLIVLVEEKISNCLSFNHLPWIKRHIRTNPDHIFHNVREILQKYGNIQFLFADGRKDATRLLEKIFFSGVDFSKFDNQLAYESKLL